MPKNKLGYKDLKISFNILHYKDKNKNNIIYNRVGNGVHYYIQNLARRSLARSLVYKPVIQIQSSKINKVTRIYKTI